MAGLNIYAHNDLYKSIICYNSHIATVKNKRQEKREQIKCNKYMTQGNGIALVGYGYRIEPLTIRLPIIGISSRFQLQIRKHIHIWQWNCNKLMPDPQHRKNRLLRNQHKNLFEFS